MLSSIFTVSLAQSAIELGCIYALVALALFVSFSILNIADLSTDGCFTLGCAVCAMVTLQGHPFLGLLAAMGAGVASGFVTAFLQTRPWSGIYSCGYYRKYGIVHHQYCSHGIFFHHQSVCQQNYFHDGKRSHWWQLV